jgi:hypothetical protein
MYRVKDRLEESKNYQIQFNDLIQAGIKPLNSIELKIINEFIAEHG